jgi:hypothetical protein
MTVPMRIGGRRTARLDALPLALELAAPWIKVLTPEDLVRRLERDVLFSTVGPRDLPERQRTMNATVAWSYQLLGGIVQVFAGSLSALASQAMHHSGIFGGDVQVHPGAALDIPLEVAYEYAALVLNGDCTLEGQPLQERVLYYLGT